MSYPSNSSPNGIPSGQSGHFTVAPHTIQSVIAAHQYKPNQINSPAPPPEILQRQAEIKAAGAAYFSGKITRSEFNAICRRIQDDGRAYDKRVADFDAREQAGQANYSDWFKEFYGCTDEEAEEYIRSDRIRADTQRANEARNRSRVLHQSRHGRGH